MREKATVGIKMPHDDDEYDLARTLPADVSRVPGMPEHEFSARRRLRPMSVIRTRYKIKTLATGDTLTVELHGSRVP